MILLIQIIFKLYVCLSGSVHAGLCLTDVSVLLPSSLWGHRGWLAVVPARGGFQGSGVYGIVLSLETLTLRSTLKSCNNMSQCIVGRFFQDVLWEGIKKTFGTACCELPIVIQIKLVLHKTDLNLLTLFRINSNNFFCISEYFIFYGSLVAYENRGPKCSKTQH